MGKIFFLIFFYKGDQISEGIFIFIPFPNRMHEINFHQRFPLGQCSDFMPFLQGGTKIKIPTEI